MIVELSSHSATIPEIAEIARTIPLPAETTQPPVISAVELRVSYTVATISARAKSFDEQFQVNRTVHFETIVLRELLRNPTKLNAKLLAQAHNHFMMGYRDPSYTDLYLALPESIKISNVSMLGHKEFPV
jgi:hypothetical protein